jgi:hypothetical protein
MHTASLRTADSGIGSFREQRIFRGVRDPGVRIQHDHGALSHFSSSGAIKSSWKTMLPCNWFSRALPGLMVGMAGELPPATETLA